MITDASEADNIKGSTTSVISLSLGVYSTALEGIGKQQIASHNALILRDVESLGVIPAIYGQKGFQSSTCNIVRNRFPHSKHTYSVAVLWCKFYNHQISAWTLKIMMPSFLNNPLTNIIHHYQLTFPKIQTELAN